MIYTYHNLPIDVKNDIDYLYNLVVCRGGKRSQNYTPKKLSEPVLAHTIRYNEFGSPVSTCRILERNVYEDSVRVLDRYVLIETQNGLYPHNYDGLFKPETSEMLEQQTDFCKNFGYGCIFFSLNKKASRTIKRVVKGHNTYSKYTWNIDGPVYVTEIPSEEGHQLIGYTGSQFRRKDGIYNSNVE